MTIPWRPPSICRLWKKRSNRRKNWWMPICGDVTTCRWKPYRPSSRT
nr:MAG TPA: hypothetical protein [Caudoviricetes sp.]